MTANLFLLAAPRTGSTQLAHWLASHPDIGLPKIKEPNHFSAHEFDPDHVRDNHLNDVDPDRFLAQGQPRSMQFAIFRTHAQYAALYAPLQQRWRLDASTSYLACPEAPTRIHSACPKARLIVLTRDPVARAVSHYRLAQRTGRTRAPLGVELVAEQAGHTPLSARFLLRPSRQAEASDRVRATFPQAQIFELRFEDMIADPARALGQIANWLAIDHTGFDLSAKARNESAAPRFPGLNAALQKTGIKTALRATLPPALKQRIKPLWFGAALPPVAPADLAALREALQ